MPATVFLGPRPGNLRKRTGIVRRVIPLAPCGPEQRSAMRGAVLDDRTSGANEASSGRAETTGRRNDTMNEMNTFYGW